MGIQEQLAQHIKGSGLSLNEVARKTDTSAATISRGVTGKRPFGGDMIGRLVDFFDLELRPRKKTRAAKAVPTVEPKEGGE